MSSLLNANLLRHWILTLLNKWLKIKMQNRKYLDLPKLLLTKVYNRGTMCWMRSLKN